MTPLEAMASQTAVVASDAGAYAEMIEPETGTVVAAGDGLALEQAIAPYLADPADVCGGGEAGACPRAQELSAAEGSRPYWRSLRAAFRCRIAAVTVTAFIIHLERATKRGEHVRGLIERLPVKAEIVDAVDALAMGEGDIAAVYARSLHSPYYPFELRKSEVACFLSHRKAWAAIVDRKLDAGLIIEDDVEVDAGFAAQLQLAIDTVAASRLHPLSALAEG